MDADIDALVAVVGLAGRFPGAPDVDWFWRNVCDGVESVQIHTATTADGTGEHYSGYGVLDDGEMFDAAFFGYPPGEALVIDPQQRVFLECAYHALEDAACDPATYDGLIGVYAGGSTTGYAAALHAARSRLPFLDDWQIRIATGPDFLATRTAHKLGLRGPAMTVQTACSTSLVAIHLAAQALLAGECDIALAGGATVHVPRPSSGYTEGGILAADGHCRAFDAKATGAVGGSAVGLVVLRPLGDALRAGNHIHAVLRGTAVNNDGGGKVGFTAPSIDGQAQVIRTAQLVAGVNARDVTYVETHGTGTPLGDPIEVAALTRAFRADTDDSGFCRIGSVKTNVGHTDAAAGVTSFIKAVFAVEHGLIPPSLHFEEANPEIDFATSPFSVATALVPWQPDGRPRLAGVNALGIGGTNAHVILEQPPVPAPTAGRTGTPQLVVLSARTPAALDTLSRTLAARLREDPALDLADVARTLQVGRPAQPFRRFAVCDGAADAAGVFAGEDPERLITNDGRPAARPVVFMYPGQGGQHVGMTRELYEREPVYREAIDAACDYAAPLLGTDLRTILFPEAGDVEKATEQMATIGVGQPAVFVVEYALTRLWQSWGVTPSAVVGHSLGAYAAACAAAILPLAEAISLVVTRGRLLQGLPAGRMAAVPLHEEELMALLPDDLSVGSVNGPGQCTVTGPAASVEAFTAELRDRGVDARLLRISTAGHSALVEPIMAEFEAAVSAVKPQPPQVRFLSDTLGRWATGDEAAAAAYWSSHLRRPVRFDAALQHLLDDPSQILVEVGPGRVLSSLARQHPAANGAHTILSSLPHPADRTADTHSLLHAAGRLWAAGVTLDWPSLHQDRTPRLVRLPLYPFDRRPYLVEPPAAAQQADAGQVIVTPDEPATETSAGDPLSEESVAGRVSQAIGDVLGINDVGEHESFFDLGGDSLIATRLAAWTRTAFGVEFSAKEVLTNPTAARIADLVEERMSAIGEVSSR
ncbi:type I polyketide synthase [Solwaraspora sp. WMMD792]|uniref:type I polyketide synthase n=1 Tax=Solwaraspora sp. WMMD792 TaxID=3016099 RepID=UPI002415F861|nr:type I polyketide synthase [Solwaraspora sp. WMMD792]MDG4773091.1 type I polyketide synthase [Solwaraspora sp. WMMD792]